MMGMEAGAITLTEEAVALSPAEPGVYLLYRGEELSYIGVAEHSEGIRGSLERHRSVCAGCPREATWVTYELSHHPRRRHRHHLSAYRERHEGRVPSCNDCQPCGC